MRSKNILVVAAHPDDEVLGCGGIIAKHSKLKDNVYLIILGEGATSRHTEKTKTSRKKVRELKEQAAMASAILGIKQIYYGDFPDNSFDSVPRLEIIRFIEKIREKVQPDIVYTHFYGDLNIDHRITCEAMLTAFRPIEKTKAQKLYAFEVLSSTEWAAQSHFVPNVYRDISNTINKKVEAFKAYKDEIKTWPHPRSIEGIEVLAKKRGSEAGLGYAEAFVLIREIER